MDQEQDRQPAVCERCGHVTTQQPARPSEPNDVSAVTAAVRQPQLLKLTTPSGRVWCVVNPN